MDKVQELLEDTTQQVIFSLFLSPRRSATSAVTAAT